MNYASFNFPLFLTAVRLVAAFIYPIFLVLFLPLQTFAWHMLLGIFFMLIGLTDFLDGYIARKYKQETVLGKLLDPIADKFLVFATVIALVYLQKIFFYWAILVTTRDVFVMGLREISLSRGFSVPVSGQGKLKTSLQLAYITLVIMNPYYVYEQAPFLFNLQYLLLISSALITLYSAISYYRSFYQKYVDSQSRKRSSSSSSQG